MILIRKQRVAAQHTPERAAPRGRLSAQKRSWRGHGPAEVPTVGAQVVVEYLEQRERVPGVRRQLGEHLVHVDGEQRPENLGVLDEQVTEPRERLQPPPAGQRAVRSVTAPERTLGGGGHSTRTAYRGAESRWDQLGVGWGRLTVVPWQSVVKRVGTECPGRVVSRW